MIDMMSFKVKRSQVSLLTLWHSNFSWHWDGGTVVVEVDDNHCNGGSAY